MNKGGTAVIRPLQETAGGVFNPSKIPRALPQIRQGVFEYKNRRKQWAEN
jgi:hypothetical protein